jgi:hypothetical protein
LAEERVSLKEHLLTLRQLDQDAERRFQDERDLRYQQRFEAQRAENAALQLASQRALDAALIAIQARLDLLNESRATISDVVAKQVSTEKFDTTISSMMDLIAALTARLNETRGRSAGLDMGWKILLGAGALALAIWGAFR